MQYNVPDVIAGSWGMDEARATRSSLGHGQLIYNEMYIYVSVYNEEKEIDFKQSAHGFGGWYV